MRNPLVLAVVLGASITAGCAANKYYSEVPDLPGGPRVYKSGGEGYYHGHCDEHGLLTNLSTDRDGVTARVEAHNNRFHKDGFSPHWAKLYTEDKR